MQGNKYIICKTVALLCFFIDEQQNLVAVFGPTTALAAKHAMSICDAKELPFIDTRWDFGVQMPTVNLYPHASQLAVALKDLVVALEWTDTFTIIYETGM